MSRQAACTGESELSPAEECLAQGDPQGALRLLQQQVRDQAADPRLRVFLFQLLCLLGQWERARTQLQVCGELDSGALGMVGSYGAALQSEGVREAVFAGQATPVALGEAQSWLPLLVEALQADARGDAAGAELLRSRAFDDAPASAGTLDGRPFDWIADADSRLGPVLESFVNGRYAWIPYAALSRVVIEEPVDLRDLVWIPAQLDFAGGAQAAALIPVRYPSTATQGDPELQMARRTEWLEFGAGRFRGLGQRVLATSADEVDLLRTREIVLQQPTAV